MEGKHYNTITGGYTKWTHKNGIITKEDNAPCYRIMQFVTGMDGNDHRVFWSALSLETAIKYLDQSNATN